MARPKAKPGSIRALGLESIADALVGQSPCYVLRLSTGEIAETFTHNYSTAIGKAIRWLEQQPPDTACKLYMRGKQCGHLYKRPTDNKVIPWQLKNPIYCGQ